MNRIAHVILLLAWMFVLTACGQYGDLYIPEDEPADEQTEEKQE